MDWRQNKEKVRDIAIARGKSLIDASREAGLTPDETVVIPKERRGRKAGKNTFAV